MAISPRKLTWDSLVKETEFTAKKCAVRLTKPATNVRLDYPAELVDVKLVTEGDDADCRTLSVTPRRDIPLGRHSFPIVLQAIDNRGEDCGLARIQATIPVEGDISLARTFSHLGVFRVGCNGLETVELYSHSARSFSVASMESNWPDARVTPETPTVFANRHSFLLEFSPGEPGEQLMHLVFQTRYEGEDETTVAVPVTLRFSTVRN